MSLIILYEMDTSLLQSTDVYRYISVYRYIYIDIYQQPHYFSDFGLEIPRDPFSYLGIFITKQFFSKILSS